MNLTVGKRLIAGFLSVALILCIVSGFSIYSIKQIESSYHALVFQKIQIRADIKEISIQIANQSRIIRGYLLVPNDHDLTNFKNKQNEITTLIDKTYQIPGVNDKIKTHMNQLKAMEKEYMQNANQVLVLYKTDKNEAISQFASSVFPFGNQMLTEAAAAVKDVQKLIDIDLQTTNSFVNSTITSVITVSILAVAIALALGIFIARMISKPVAALTVAAGQIAAGDLTVDSLAIKNRDEIGKLANGFNQMVYNLREIIQQVGQSAEQVATSSEELLASSEQTSQATENIASTVQEVATGNQQQANDVERAAQTIDEMAAGLQQITLRSQTVLSTADQAARVSVEGNQTVQKAINQMNTIHSTTREVAYSIQDLGNHAQSIGKIVETITGIANQTNLLALNAAIEAARAGEHGRGFAVVADEVRKLAEESSNSAKQIAEYITTIQNGIQKAVQSMKIGASEVNNGIEAVNLAKESFEKIYQSVENVSKQIAEVSAATEQMSAGTEDIVRVINHVVAASETTSSATQTVSAATEEQLASIEEIASSASSLSRMAMDLQLLISKFKV
ncbi:methyl-accepting chemotaxis protein [Fodinisporobacter ferrooxydans]|uniref:Methyl-accepting chemotaxis protein n=1 Tax=Fodinisporobacter ferrooxydans TaxID=2901836 RepID=A0ABY4CKS9_9BACL|nr:methyl-accepting chemotaxis protein [Alicyclobacillaceae bacterium MYW30-H2]